jgi:hypothetical protein
MSLSLLLASCSLQNHIAGRPIRPQYFEDVSAYDQPAVFKALEEAYENATASETEKQRARDKYVRWALRVFDARYQAFLDDLAKTRKGFDAGADIVAIALGTASVLFTPVDTKSILAGLAVATTGSKIAINKAYFYEQTLPVIIQQMESDRQVVLADIQGGIRQPPDRYRLEDALRDLTRYYNAGTIDGALIAIQQHAAEGKKAAEETMKELRSNNEPVVRRRRGSIDMWLLAPASEAERSGRLKDLKSVIGTKYGQETAAISTLWLQSASAAQLQDIMTILRIELREEKEIEDFRKERSKEFITQNERAKKFEASLMTWIGTGGNFEKAKVMIKTWFATLPDALEKTIQVESIREIAARHKVATEPLMDAGQPSPAKFASFIDSLGSADNTMRFCVDILRFKMLEEAEKLVTS